MFGFRVVYIISPPRSQPGKNAVSPLLSQVCSLWRVRVCPCIWDGLVFMERCARKKRDLTTLKEKKRNREATAPPPALMTGGGGRQKAHALGAGPRSRLFVVVCIYREKHLSSQKPHWVQQPHSGQKKARTGIYACFAAAQLRTRWRAQAVARRRHTRRGTP